MPTKMPNLYYWLTTNATSQWMVNAYPENYKKYSGWIVRAETNDGYCNKSTRVFSHYRDGIIFREDGPAVYAFSDSKTLENIRYFVDNSLMLVLNIQSPEQSVKFISLDYREGKLEQILLKEKFRMIKELD